MLAESMIGCFLETARRPLNQMASAVWFCKLALPGSVKILSAVLPLVSSTRSGLCDSTLQDSASPANDQWPYAFHLGPLRNLVHFIEDLWNILNSSRHLLKSCAVLLDSYNGCSFTMFSKLPFYFTGQKPWKEAFQMLIVPVYKIDLTTDTVLTIGSLQSQYCIEEWCEEDSPCVVFFPHCESVLMLMDSVLLCIRTLVHIIWLSMLPYERCDPSLSHCYMKVPCQQLSLICSKL